MAWELNGNSGTNPNSNFVGTTDDQPLLIKTNNSEAVRVNTGTGTSKVEILAQDGLAITGFQPFITLRDANGGNARSCVQGVNGDIVMVPNSFIGNGSAMVLKSETGNIGIGTSTPDTKLHVAGDVFVTGDVKLAIGAGDCAEEFDIADAGLVEPGTVMVLGEDGILLPSQFAYDKRVAGVVSGAGSYRPGIILDKQGDEPNRKPIALVGKVYCKVDAQHGAVEIGDLLTTSPTPGYAMKASDQAKSFGAVIGKALRPLASGQALIPILVSLQ